MSNGCVASVKSCTSSLLDPVYKAASYVDEKVSLSQRVGHLYETADNISVAPYLGSGVLAGIVTFLSAGFRTEIGNLSQKMLGQVGKPLLPEIYKSFLGVFYPDMPKEIDDKLSSRVQAKELNSYADEMIRNLLEKGDAYSGSKNIFVRHVASRGTYVVTAGASVVSRVVLGALGAVAALFSFIPYLPYKSQLMHFAYQELQFLGAVQDVFHCAVKFLNPWTKVVYGGK